MVKSSSDIGPPSMLHLLHRASQHADQLFAAAIGNTGLTARQLIVLDAVARARQPSQTDICTATGIDRSTLADIVRRLVGRGLIFRRRTKEDARAYALRLTEEGRLVLAQCLPIALDVDRQLVSALPEADRHKLAETLQLILEQAATASAAVES